MLKPLTETASGEDISILIAYSDPVISAGLSALLREHPEFSVRCSGSEGCTPRLAPRPDASADVVIADYDSGIRLSAAAADSNARVVVLTHNDGEASIRHAFAQGVRGYFLLGCSLHDLAAGIRAVHEGGVAVTPRVANRIAESMNQAALTRREQSVLKQMTLGQRNKAIAREFGLTEGTIKAHVKSILGKLRVTIRGEAVAIARRRGLLSEQIVDQELQSIGRPRKLRQRSLGCI